MTEPIQDGVSNAGDVEIRELSLIAHDGLKIDLQAFMVELNLFEDIFSPAMYGNIMISDSLGIIEKGQIIGEEFLCIDFVTPSTKDNIRKTFRVYNLSDRQIVSDDKTQGFILHFCSQEVFVDATNKVYKTFSGRIDEVAATIYTDYLSAPRTIGADANGKFINGKDSTLTILNETDNTIKFTSPGWGPLKCLSWLASKSISKDKKAADALFFETSNGFYFGSVGTIIQIFKDEGKIAGEFYYTPSNLNYKTNNQVSVSGVQYRGPDLNREYKIVQEFRIVDTFNTLKSHQSGYYANQLLVVDLLHKKYKYNDFDYGDKYADYTHLDKFAPFTKGQYRNPAAVTQVAFQQAELYTGAKNNINERVSEITQNRMALLAGLNGLKIECTVPGRTDFEAGSVVYFGMPKMGPKDASDKTETFDEMMSGLYLVSCIRHKIAMNHHVMVMELVRDSVGKIIE